ncbi:MAG: hypothetical protein IPM77_12815 [Crocinitomicaceae bacterium]|nr:hypothetical protein [Crocinitomicaceae bacterium]
MWIDKIGNVGALERNFRPEINRLVALPIETSKLRLYCYRISTEIVLIGNGGHKETRTFNEDPELNNYAKTLFSIGNILMSLIKSAQVNLYNQELYNIPVPLYLQETK